MGLDLSLCLFSLSLSLSLALCLSLCLFLCLSLPLSRSLWAVVSYLLSIFGQSIVMLIQWMNRTFGQSIFQNDVAAFVESQIARPDHRWSSNAVAIVKGWIKVCGLWNSTTFTEY